MKFRKATMADADNLLRWKNDPAMRKYSIVSHKKIKKADHLKWLKKHFNEIWIIGDNFGDVRVTNGEIAIKVAKEHRGKGYSTQAVKFVVKKFGHLKAKIVDGNVPSMRLFIRCGFKIVGHRANYYILQI